MYPIIDFLLTKQLKKGFEHDFIHDMSNRPYFSEKQEAIIFKLGEKYGFFDFSGADDYEPCAADCTCAMCRSCTPSQPQIKIFLHENPDAKAFVKELHSAGMIDGLRNIIAIS